MNDPTVTIKDVPAIFEKICSEISKIVVGQDDTIRKIFTGLLCRGHVLLVGVPGLAKTTLVESFAKSLELNFNRIQFTPDLMPSDITGNEILQENQVSSQRELVFHKGPVFTNILLGDEINRTPPKTQSALLQAMQEGKVTSFGKTENLDAPFMVLATQNPIEQEGTYPLPEAQLDRFLFSLQVGYPSESEEIEIVKKHTFIIKDKIRPILNRNIIMALQDLVLKMTISDHVFAFAVKVLRMTRPESSNPNNFVNSYVQWGAGPRATSHLLLAAKAHAMIDGRPTPTIEDVKKMLFSVLNHRIILNFKAEAENITVSKILQSLLDVSA